MWSRSTTPARWRSRSGPPVRACAIWACGSNTELSVLPKLRSIIARDHYDVVHAHLYRSQIYARPAARLAGTPVVLTTEHSIGETHIERRKMTAGVRALYLASELFSDATIAVSDIGQGTADPLGRSRREDHRHPQRAGHRGTFVRLRGAPRVRDQFGIPRDTYVIGALGRLDPNKRIDLMVEAAVPVLGERCKILVIGRGEDQARVEAAVARLGVTDHVIFGGFQSDTAAMMAAFDLYVAASAQETFGLSVLEAMASGLPVLYTTCPALDGIQTSQARQVTGTAEALGAEIRKAVEAGPLPREADHAVFERYGMESVVRRIDDLYERLLADRIRSSRRRRRGSA